MTDELQQRHDELVCEVHSLRKENVQLRQTIELVQNETSVFLKELHKLRRERNLCIGFLKCYVENVENP